MYLGINMKYLGTIWINLPTCAQIIIITSMEGWYHDYSV